MAPLWKTSLQNKGGRREMYVGRIRRRVLNACRRQVILKVTAWYITRMLMTTKWQELVLRFAGFLDFVHRAEFSINESVSVFRWDSDTYSVGSLRKCQSLTLALSKGLHRVGVALLPEHRNRSSFRNVVFFLVYTSRIPDDGQSAETQCFWVLYTVVRALWRNNPTCASCSVFRVCSFH
jgi:hypothetical protein